jgi:hypothetical protein
MLAIEGAPAPIDLYIAADRPAKLLQSLQEPRGLNLRFGVVRHTGHKHPNAAHPAGLLGADREWPSDGAAAEKRQEVTPV